MRREKEQQNCKNLSQGNKQTQHDLDKVYKILLENRQKKIQHWK